MTNDLTIEVTFDSLMLEKIQEAKDKDEFCGKFERCTQCPLYRAFDDCDESFDAFKKELEK